MYIVITLIALILDQMTKYLAIVYLKGQPAIKIIDNFLYFTYLENKGAAFGMLDDKPMFFTIFASAFILFMIFYLLKNRNEIGNFYKFGFVMIIVGALGNLIDRIRLGFVVDFIFSPLGGLYDFPVFNLADVYLTVTAILLLIYAFFFDKEEKDKQWVKLGNILLKKI